MNYCVCYCIDNNDYNNLLLFCSLYSLRKHNTIKAIIMTFSDNPFIPYYERFDNVEIMRVDEIYQYKYEKIQKSTFLDEENNEFIFREDIPNMCYFRFEIPILLKDYDVVLYLDTDTEIKRDLTPLFELDFEGNEIIGQLNRDGHLQEVRDVLENFDIHTFDSYIENKENYICSGVMLFNIRKLWESDYDYRLNTLLDFEYQYYGNHLWKDEFLVNMAFYCKTSTLLDCEDVNEYLTLDDIPTNSYIVHYICDHKDNLLEKYKDVLIENQLL